MNWLTMLLTTGGLIISFASTYLVTYRLAEKYKWNYISWIIGVIIIFIGVGITLGLSYVSQDVMVIVSAFAWGFIAGYWSGLVWYKLRYREIKKKGV